MNRPSIAQARCIEHNRLRTGSVGRFEGAEPAAERGGIVDFRRESAEGSEPHFRELEPAERVAAADRAPSTSSVSERSAAVWGRPTWFDSGLR